MKYFNDCTMLDEIKTRYRDLAKKLHPDLGGDEEQMKELINEYDFICAKLLAGENLNSEETEQRRQDDEKYRIIIEKIIALEGIVIEIVAAWIWVSGNTYAVKDRLKEAGLLFASKKKMWYWRPEEAKVFRSSGKSMEEIRAKYGSEYVNKSYNGNRSLK
ncbi:hypothetical protein [Chitinophaga filiformis]|uniref:DnaJ domain-containing protein n=1 Tax=Chitinophaga filiformis TaxID=104663 RepID=A0A1G7MEA2_CHIFI|nr:hypothetical protein [Chitinophaga filiformis]SDF59996.1 hypothetical protein SAMN04488121_102389 [Chitinophaga filiformis]